MTLKEVESKSTLAGTEIFKIKDTDIHFSSTADLNNMLSKNVLSMETYEKAVRDYTRTTNNYVFIEKVKKITPIEALTNEIKMYAPDYKLLTKDEYNSKLSQKIENTEDLEKKYIEFLKLECDSVQSNLYQKANKTNDVEVDNSLHK